MILSRAVLVSFSGHCRRSTRGSMPRRPAPPPFCIIIPHIRRICKKPRAGPRKANAGSAGLVPEHHHLFAVWTIPALVKVMRFYGLPASEEHSADMLQLRLSHPSRIERRPGPGLADNIPCYHPAITNRTFHDISSLRLPTSLLHHTIPPQQLQPVFRSGSHASGSHAAGLRGHQGRVSRVWRTS